MTDKTPDPIDIEIGKRIALRRSAKKLSQADLAKKIGVSFQQVQKYESAANRVSGSRLVKIAEALDAQAGDFLPCPSADNGADMWSMMRRSFPGSELVELFTTMDAHRQTSLLSVARALRAPTPADMAGALKAA